MNRSIVIVVASCSVLVSCGGSSSLNPANPNIINGEANGELAYNACESSYYREILGTYQGEVEFSLTFDDELKRNCIFDVELRIAGTPLPSPGAGCRLTASYSGTVEQVIIRPVDDPFVYQCIVNQGSLFITDPNSSVVDPEVFYENISYPVSMSLSGDFAQPNNGPYISNPDVNVLYTNFIGSSTPLIRSISFEGESEIKLLPTRNGEDGLEVETNMVKEQ